ncbi:hypothetical protein C3L33_22549, partial [Rhododendron williamsianum]
MKADQVSFHSISFWVQLWGLPFEFVNPIIGEIIGKRIGSFHAVDDRKVVGERGRFLRVRVGVPIDKPLKHGSYVILFCCMNKESVGVKPSDEKNGVLKEGRFRQWMKANSGGRQQTGSKWETNGGRRDGENSDERPLRSGLIEIKDSDWISLNGKEIRMGELIPNSLGFHSWTSEARGGPLDLVKNSSLGSIGPGLVFQQSEAEIQVEQIVTEVNPLGLELPVLSVGIGTGPNVEGLESNLQEVAIHQLLDKENLGLISPFFVGAIGSMVSSSSTGRGKKGKGYKKASVQANTHKLVSGKEASLVMGKRRKSNGAESPEGDEAMGDGMYDGEKRCVLCEINASGARVEAASHNWSPTP